MATSFVPPYHVPIVDPSTGTVTPQWAQYFQNLGALAKLSTVGTSFITDGAVTEVKQTLSDVTTWNVSSTRHGYAPKSPADATKFLNGAATPAWAAVKDSDLSTSDITTNNVTSTKHGFAPKSPADATQFLNGAATPAFAAVKDSDLSTSDITTNNVSTSKHGFTPKLPNDATKYLDGTGAYSVPTTTGPGAGDVSGPGSATGDDFATFNGASGKIIKDSGLALDTDGTLAADSDSKIPSQKAVKTYVDAQVGGGFSPFYESVTKPAAADFTTVNSNNANHGTATLTDLGSRGVLLDVVMANSGVLTNGFSYKAAVSNTLVSAEAFFQPVWDIQSNYFHGIGLRDNAGKIHAWGLRNSNFCDIRFTDINTFSTSTTYGSLGALSLALPMWFKIVKSGSNFIFSASPNGETYTDYLTVSATAFIGATINDVGILVTNNIANTTTHQMIACYSFTHS